MWAAISTVFERSISKQMADNACIHSTQVEAACRVQTLTRDSLDLLALKFLLHQSNVRIRPEYRELLFG